MNSRYGPLRSIFLIMIIAAGVLANEPAADRSAENLRWSRNEIRIDISTSFLRNSSSIKPESDVQGAVERSFASWAAVTGLRFQIVWSERTSISPAGRVGDGVSLITIAPSSENLLALAGEKRDLPAMTRVFFGRRGEITEADIVLNPIYQFSTDGSFGTFDLQSTLTHEIGHLLGIPHSPLTSSTMSVSQSRNGVFGLTAFTKRSLSDDDENAARARYASGTGSAIIGRIEFAGSNEAGDAFVWLEESETGRIVRAREIADNGRFVLDGIPGGRYKVYVHGKAAGGAGFFGGSAGEIVVRQGTDAKFDRTLGETEAVCSVESIGFNGQFEDSPVLVNSGKSFTVFALAGVGSDKAVRMASTSPAFRFGNSRGTALGGELTIFESLVRVNESSPVGDYTIVVESPAAGRCYFPGALTIGTEINPWNAYDLD